MSGLWGAALAASAGALHGGERSPAAMLWAVVWTVGLAVAASWGWRRLLALVWALGGDPRRRLAWSTPLVRGAIVLLVAGLLARVAWIGEAAGTGAWWLAAAAVVLAWRQGQDALAGGLLALRRPFALGDEIGVGDVVGRVDEIGLTVVRVRGPGGATIELPTRVLKAGPLRRPGPGRRALPVAVEVPLPDTLAPDEALELLRDHALCSPYLDVGAPLVLEVLGGGRARCVAVPVQPDEADELRSDLTSRAEGLAAAGASHQP